MSTNHYDRLVPSTRRWRRRSVGFPIEGAVLEHLVRDVDQGIKALHLGHL
jgi:hypothetical protein